MFKGYRTIVFGMAVGLFGIAGVHIAPEVMDRWLDLIFAMIMVGIVGLRVLTSTPIGVKIEQSLGLSPATIDEIKTVLSDLPIPDVGLLQAVTDLATKVDALQPPPVALSTAPLTVTAAGDVNQAGQPVGPEGALATAAAP